MPDETQNESIARVIEATLDLEDGVELSDMYLIADAIIAAGTLPETHDASDLRGTIAKTLWESGAWDPSILSAKVIDALPTKEKQND